MTYKNGIEALILAAVKDEPLHGYAISKRIRLDSGGVLKFGEGQLYPALHRLEEAGMLTAEWLPQEGKPPRKLYAITDAGISELQRHVGQWKQFADSVGHALTGTKEVAHV